jgi:hypothetical protein
MRKVKAEEVFDPQWPEGLAAGQSCRVPCDDKGRDGQTRLQIYVSDVDGDVYVMVQEADHTEDPAIAGVRIRTHIGGGRNLRTRQALLWLARAIQLDNAENGRAEGGGK